MVEIIEADDRDSTHIAPGDSVSFQGLFYLIGMASDNTAPRAIARVVGQKVLDSEGGSGGVEARFVEEMNSEAEELEYADTEFLTSVRALMSPARSWTCLGASWKTRC